MRGIRDIREIMRGGNLRGKVERLGFTLRMAWQRAWRGYDDSMWWDIDTSFILLHIELLNEMKANRHGIPYGYTTEEWDDILDEMLELLGLMGGDEMWDIEEAEKHKDKFFKLYSEHFYRLWD